MGFFYPEWQKSIRIDITTPPTTTGYQVKVEIPWQPGMKDDFSDLRFSDYYRTLPYWIETSTTRSTAIVWVKLTEINAACQEFFCYYGNGRAASESSGDTTFDFFEDFVTALDTTTKWVVMGGGTAPVISGGVATFAGAAPGDDIYSQTRFGTNYAIRARSKSDGTDANGYYFQIDFFNNDGSVNNSLYLVHAGTTSTSYAHYSYKNGTPSFVDPAWTGITASVYHTFDIMRNGSSSAIYQIDTTTKTETTQVPTAEGAVRLVGGSGYTQTCDWILVRKYQTTEPTCTPAAYGINIAFYQGYLQAKGCLIETIYGYILTAVQHESHIDLSWTEP